ncbi:hypothetical protein SAMN05444156_1044 [Verrucomicrobium sp. GAS474]|uniref:hypothetical protein n=1 Tax=Verrucomicrobium sp. GAS474 TaxID=1882831 RepID=UPI00087B9CE5|nr:hypothetical protein [Verrucomicrobium sp. GAS474]SDT95568.1 hypothetical protein SAMN05444156_1044 [Verrucomicrobium sp. GAS474]
MISQGYVAIFKTPFDKETVGACVASWLTRFDAVEQVAPHTGAGTGFTLSVKEPKDVMYGSDSLQFRVLQAPDFAWVYLTMGRRAIETSALPHPDLSLPLDLLLDLPGLAEIVPDYEDGRLTELEQEGLL